MYNGIGLQTARGSATNGYVVKNQSLLKTKPKRQDEDYLNIKNENIKLLEREPNIEILEHEIKREVEIKCMDLRIKLEDEGEDDEEIEKQITELRKTLNKRVREEDLNFEKQKKVKTLENNKLLLEKQNKNDRMMDALGIKKEGYKVGKVFENIGQNKNTIKEEEDKKSESSSGDASGGSDTMSDSEDTSDSDSSDSSSE